MKFLQLFEEHSKPYREVDLQELFNNFWDPYIYGKVDLYNTNFQVLLNKILIDKDIEFHRVVNPLDDEITYTFNGKVESVFIDNGIVVKLYGEKNLYILAKIYKFNTIKNPQIIKIYNSELSKTEKEINYWIEYRNLSKEDKKLWDDSKKYNL